MTPDLRAIVETAVQPALDLLPKQMSSKEAVCLLLAIGLQESRLTYRRQHGSGPARGLMQFECGTGPSRSGVWGVYLHMASRAHLKRLCVARGCGFSPEEIWARLEVDDVLAFGVGRLLLLTDPKPLPELGDVDGAWNYYLRNWRPGKPHPETWGRLYAKALEAAMA